MHKSQIFPICRNSFEEIKLKLSEPVVMDLLPFESALGACCNTRVTCEVHYNCLPKQSAKVWGVTQLVELLPGIDGSHPGRSPLF